eukprot:EG_transcript_7404
MQLQERVLAAVLCSAVGDAIGYRNGQWEFCYSGVKIHQQLAKQFHSVNGIKVTKEDFRLSDDTIMSIATSEALLAAFPRNSQARFTDPTFTDDLDRLMQSFADHYVRSMEDMAGRGPGPMTVSSCRRLKGGTPWNRMPFNKAGGGCGGSMRAAPIGLQLFGESRRPWLVAVGIEAGRITHAHPTGFLGSLAAAAFTAFALEGVAPADWGCKFLAEVIPLATEYLKTTRDWGLVEPAMAPFLRKLSGYLKLRGIQAPGGTPAWPTPFGPAERDAFYTSLSYDGWGGASGDDSVIIAYDAVLGCGGSWEEFLLRGALHGGDSDSTGTIGGAFFGALYGLRSVPAAHYTAMEYHDRLVRVADAISGNVDAIHRLDRVLPLAEAARRRPPAPEAPGAAEPIAKRTRWSVKESLRRHLLRKGTSREKDLAAAQRA